MESVKSAIQTSLTAFVTGNLTKNSLALFEALGYATDRRASLDRPTFLQFKNSFIPVDSHFNEEKAQVKQWKHVDLLFQLSGNELIKTTDMFDSKVVVTKDDGNKIAIESYLFFVVGLESQSYSRTQLSHIPREINRLFPMPAMILFKYGSFLTLAVIDRRLHRRDESKDVLEKVTLIKDISIISPHRAHIEILFDLSLDELKENSKEPITNFIALHNAWRKTLNISELNKKFYRQIADWFYWAVSNVEYPLAPNITNERENASINVIRLLTRIIFVWFLKEKNLVPDDLFDEKKITAILKDDDLQSEKKWNYYRGILQNLFFATLNQKMNTEKEPKNREWVSEKRASSGYNEDYTIANKYRFPELFKNPEQALQLFSTIPFLNGGLFDCLDRRGNKQKGDIFIDGFTRHIKPQPKVPNMLFFGEKRKVDLSKVFEDKKWSKEEVKGLIHILNDYKFTIAENTPIEEEVALDPELLGRIFENLLAAYNPETGTTARKATGSFYTPREIVNYMVDESLLAYLKNVMLDEAVGAVLIGHEQVDAFGNDARKGQLKIEDKVERNPWKEKEEELENHLRGLLSYSEKPNPLNITDTDRLISAIGRCKILDPACGSGAFPMGMLLKTVHILHKLDPNNAKWQQVQEDAARTIPDPEIQRETLERIEEAFSPENNYADYGRKLVLIQNCIYGIDIQPVAVQISKLRFFISLLVDQKYSDTKENRGVLSLPNLETKFVAANTLIGIDESIQGSLHNADIQQLVGKLHDVRKQIFNARSYRNKKELQKQDEQLRKQLGALLEQKTLEAQKVLERQIATLQSQKTISEKKLKEKDLRTGVRKQTEEAIKKIDKQVEELQTKLLDRHIVETNAMRLADWDPYDQNAHADFFDKEWMFGNSEGFDIVIGNPPYVRQEEIKEIKPMLEAQYSCYTGVCDLYVYFYEKGINLLAPTGTLTYISSNKFFRAGYGEKLRSFLTSNTIIRRMIDFGDRPVFEATTYPCVMVVSRSPIVNPQENIVSARTIETVNELERFEQVVQTSSIKMRQNDLSTSGWRIEGQSVITLLEKIRKTGMPLEEYVNGKIYRGITTGFNDAFVIDDKTKKSLIKEDKNSTEVIKPFLRGRDIKRYAIENQGLWLIYVSNQWTDSNREKMEPEKFFKKAYPAIHNHLKQFETQLKARDDQGVYWWEMRPCKYLAEFEKPKIISARFMIEPLFGYDKDDRFTNDACYILPTESPFLAAILNSKLGWWVLSRLTNQVQQSYSQVHIQYLSKLPIAKPTESQQREIEELVGKILHLRNLRKVSEDKQSNLPKVTELEREIDLLVYHLYNLTLEEVRIIDPTVTEEEWKKT